ncbi:MAG TPA: acyltransferase family protein [Oscillospiraceae bacterium]|nr:acyltransferase family protein [Oscillospiraceae bacterium]
MKSKRLYYVDWLRVLVILSLIPFHAAFTFLKLGNVYIKAPMSSLEAIPFVVITTCLEDFFMTLLFFVSGIATYYSFQSRQANQYIKERIHKLLLPFLFGTILLCPLQAYLKAIYEGFHGNYLQFIPEFFSAKIVYYLGYAHLWFLLYLFIFSLLCVPLFKKWQSTNRIQRIVDFLVKGNHILLPIAVIVLLELFLRPFFHTSQTLIMDWANDTVYLSMFVFGYIFAADQRILVKLREYFKLSVILVVLSLVLLFFLNYQWEIAGSSAVYLTVMWAAIKGIYECSAIVFLICICSKYLNNESKQIKYLSKASFPIYIFHFLPLTFFILIFIKMNLNIYLKYLLIISLSYLAVFLIYEVISKLKVLKQKIFPRSANS